MPANMLDATSSHQQPMPCPSQLATALTATQLPPTSLNPASQAVQVHLLVA